MEKLIELINERFVEWVIVIFATIAGFLIYLTSTSDPLRNRIRGAFQGAIIAASCGYPIWTHIGNGNLALLIGIVITLCITGQFAIDPLQKAVPKLINKILTKVESFIDRFTGGH